MLAVHVSCALPLVALGAAAVFVAASLLWHPLFTWPAIAAMAASLLLFPAAAIWWPLSAVVLWRRPSPAAVELRRRLAAAWLALLVLLPAHFGWVWVDRVQWIVF